MSIKNPARAFCSCGIFDPSWRNRDGDERTLIPKRSSGEQTESSCCGCAVSLLLSFLLFLLNEFHRVAGDHQFFIGGDNADGDFRIGGRNDGLFAASLVGFGIYLNAEEL